MGLGHGVYIDKIDQTLFDIKNSPKKSLITSGGDQWTGKESK